MAQTPEFLPRATISTVYSPHILMTSFSFAWRIGSADDIAADCADDADDFIRVIRGYRFYLCHPRL